MYQGLPSRQPVSRPRAAGWRRQVEAVPYLGPSLALFSAFVFYPIVRSVYLSLYLTDPLGRPRVFVGLGHYADILTSPAFLRSLATSALFVSYTVPTGIAVALVLALLAHQPLRGIRLFQLVFSSPLAISVATGATIFLMLMNPITGILNYFLGVAGLPRVAWLTDPRWALAAVAMASVWMRLGFNFVLLLGGLQNIPAELYEAARVDGAGPWAQTRHVTLPMLSPTLFFAAVVGVIHAFQAFGEVDIMTSGGPAGATNLVVYQIYQEAFQNFQFGAASAQALVLFLVIMVLTYFQFRFGERRVHYQ